MGCTMTGAMGRVLPYKYKIQTKKTLKYNEYKKSQVQMQTEMNKVQTDQILKVPKNTARKKCKKKTTKCQMNQMKNRNGQIHEQYS